VKRLGHSTIIVLLVGVLGAEPGRAEEARPLSLRQAIERAVAGNLDLRRERVAVAKATAKQMAVAGQFDVRLNARLAAQRDVVPAVDCGIACELSAGTTPTTLVGVGLTRNLETGGRLSIGGFVQRGSYAPVDSQPPSDNVYQSSLALTFTHPLLRGFGTDIALAGRASSKTSPS